MAKTKTSSKAKRLVIVESPAKAKTINKYLGEGYVVKASMGHVRDLPERSLAIDVEDAFRPTYEIVSGRKKAVSELKKLADGAEAVFLATDLDREGEAIAWHLAESLKLTPAKTRRVIFNEITESAIRQAFEHPHTIDMDKVNAQQARRILDRIVGYELSPLLWKKIAKGLSAGRVQSVAVRLIVDREREIRAFIPQEQWRIAAHFAVDLARAGELAAEWSKFLDTAGPDDDGPRRKDRMEWLAAHGAFRAELATIGGKEFAPTGRYDASASPESAFASAVDEAERVAEALGFACRDRKDRIWSEYRHRGLRTIELIGELDRARAAAFRVTDIQTKRTKSKPSPPFTTASLQQAAANQLSFATSRTMRIAQALYEGIDLGGGDGSVGLITYMRTDSTNLSRESVEAVRGWIQQHHGDKYLPSRPNAYASAARAQEAHEAIRPTDVTRTPEAVRGHLSTEQWKLYNLIWRRFVACQMTPAEWDTTAATIEADTSLGTAVFKANGRTLAFDGFYAVMGVPRSGEEQVLPALNREQPVAPLDLLPTQHYSSPPPRYTEASLVKKLEAEGIGRPSTYATIIQTIQDRGYVEQIDRRFHATDKGAIVTDKLMDHFPEVMDVRFTSHMEEQLDKIEEAHLDWVQVLHEFYDPFHRSLNKAHDEMQAVRSEKSPHTCPTCGKPMVYRWSKTGRFLSCSGYPTCTTAFNIDREGNPIVPQTSDVTCDKCGRPMVLRRSRTGMFLGCSGYPECTNTIECDETGTPKRLVREQDIRETCEQCGAPMAVKWRGRRAFLGCSAYPKCRGTKSLPPDVRLDPPPKTEPEDAGFPCEKCGRPMVVRTGRRGKFLSCSGFPRCRTSKPFEKLEELRATAAAKAAENPAGNATDDSVPWDDAEGESSDGDATGKAPGKADAKAKRAGQRSATGAGKTAARGKAASTSGPARDKKKADGNGQPVSEAFIEHAQSLGFGVTKFGNLYADELREAFECPACGSPMSLKRGPWGPFLSCEGFPKCKTTARLRNAALEEARSQMGGNEKKAPPEPTDIDCERCGAKMLIRTGRSGKFLGCSNYPKCRNTRPIPTDMLSLGTK